MKLKDKVAIITGGTKGIGYGVAEEYLKEGAKVVVIGRNEKTGEECIESLRKISNDIYFLKGDVSDIESIDNSIAFAVEKFGRLDIYVANAGINDSNKTHFLDITQESYDKIMDINLKGVFFGGQRAARQMKKQGDGGAIINVSSVNAYLALDSQMVYTTSKGGISQLTKVEAVALAPYGIKVNAMAPGPIDTELMQRVGSDKQLMGTIISRTPIGRIGTINECGRLAVFLACSDSDFIFGQSIYNDGGRSFQAFPVPGYKTLSEDDYNEYLEMKNGK